MHRNWTKKLPLKFISGFTYIVQRIRGRVDALVESPVDAEGEVVVDVVGKSFTFQNEFDDSGSDRL